MLPPRLPEPLSMGHCMRFSEPITNTMKTSLRTITNHVGRHSPIYIWLPAILLLVLFAIWGVGQLTGRKQFQPSDPSSSADVLVDIGFRCVPIILSLIFTWLVKSQDKLNRHIVAEGTGALAVSRLQTVLLIALFLYVLTH